MNPVILKTTLLRSNPQVIRQFAFDADTPVRQLLQTAALLHGFEKNGEDELLLYGGQKADPEKPLSELLSPDPSAFAGTIRRPMHPDYGEQNFWQFRLEYLGTAQEQAFETLPCLLRYRGFHPFESTYSIVQCNANLQALEKGGGFFENWKYLKLDDFLVQRDVLNRKLARLASAQGEDVRIRPGAGTGWSRLLEIYKVDEIKAMLSRNHLWISYQGRKADMIRLIVSECNRDSFWEGVLRKMDLREYRMFRDLALEGGKKESEDSRNFPVLKGYCMLAWSSAHNLLVPSELLSYYEKWMESEGDKAFILEKQLEAALLLACRLYCLSPKRICRKLYELLYSDAADFDRLWAEKADTSAAIFPDAENIRFFEKEHVYAGREMKETDIPEAVREIADIAEYYIPAKKEAEEILKNGLSFSASTAGRIQKALEREKQKSYYGYSEDARRYVRDIYQMFHLGYGIDEVVTMLDREYFRFQNRVDYSEIRRVLVGAQGEVRIASLQGFTAPETINRNAQRKQAVKKQKKTGKVLPNDPCPCGSGLKYKRCHGKYKK